MAYFFCDVLWVYNMAIKYLSTNAFNVYISCSLFFFLIFLTGKKRQTWLETGDPVGSSGPSGNDRPSPGVMATEWWIGSVGAQSGSLPLPCDDRTRCGGEGEYVFVTSVWQWDLSMYTDVDARVRLCVCVCVCVCVCAHSPKCIHRNPFHLPVLTHTHTTV